MAQDRRSEYYEKLRDPRWQKKRLEILQRDNWSCQACFDETSMLAVHHLYYVNGREPWEYPGTALVTLCSSCHEEEEERRRSAESDLVLCLKQIGAMSNGFHALCEAFIATRFDDQNDANPLRCGPPWGLIKWHLIQIIEGERNDTSEYRERYLAPFERTWKGPQQ